MSKFYIEAPEQVYGCFRCGELMGDIREANDGYHYICENCGEVSVISFVNALDILNDLYIKGDLSLANEEIYLDFEE